MKVAADEKIASEEAQKALAIREDCEKDLAKALPALKAAEKALSELEKKDLVRECSLLYLY